MTFLTIGTSISISKMIESHFSKISSPFSSNRSRSGIRLGLLEIDPAISPLLSNIANHVPMPSGSVNIYSVLTLCLFNFCNTSVPSGVSSTIPKKVGVNSTLAMSSTTLRATPP